MTLERGIRAGPLAIAAVGLAAGAFSFAVVRGEAFYAFAGDSAAGAVAELAAGYALIAVGVVSWARRGQRHFGALLAIGGVAWFVAEWNNPEIGSSPAFTAGLLLFAAAPPIVANAALAYPARRLGRLDRLCVALAYTGALIVLGLLPALAFDPASAGCAQCPANGLLVHASPDLVDDLNRIGVQFGLAWAAILVAVLAVRLFSASQAVRRQVWPVLGPAIAYMALVAVDFAHALDRGFVGNDASDVDLRLAQAGSLLALACGVAWNWVRARRTRGELARVVVDLAASPAPGGLRDALRRALGDPSLELAYPVADGRLVDLRGRAANLDEPVTALARDGREVARVSHRPGLFDDPGIVEELAAAARLALENERLRAEAGAQLEDLRASRARVIATGDAERRRLERDLHDGAQQQLVALAFSLRLARPGLGAEVDARLEEADGELRAALEELRELANGIFPAVLADAGLAAALEALAEEAPIPVEISPLPEARFDPSVEAAAYFLVAETVRGGGAGALTISAARRDGRLVVDVGCDGVPGDLSDLEDRVGALDGSLKVVREHDRRVRVTAEIPCES
jgi:signal transduction histidine kinase